MEYLLLKDLCARLPYGVYVVDVDENDNIISTAYNLYDIDIRFPFPKDCSSIKPYLRSMSSMTEEEMGDLVTNILDGPIIYDEENNTIFGFECNTFEQFASLENWLNSHHFDYRGLIEKGLALESPEGMYKI